MNSKLRLHTAYLEMTLAAAAWGFAFVVVKDSLDRIPVTYMLAFRFSIAAIACIAIFWKKLRELNLSYIRHGALLGFLVFFGYYTQTLGCKYTTAGKNAFLTTTYVIIVPFLAWRLFHKKPQMRIWIAAVLDCGGIALLSLRSDFSINIGDLLTLICSIGYATHIIFSERFVQTESPVLLTAVQLFFTAIYSWIAAPIIEGPIPKGIITQDNITAMLYLGLMSSMLSYLLQTDGQKYAKAETASLLLSTEAVFGILFSCIFLHESFTLRIAAGCFSIFVAIVIAECSFHLPTKRMLHCKKSDLK